jgi:hypothetical protein
MARCMKAVQDESGPEDTTCGQVDFSILLFQFVQHPGIIYAFVTDAPSKLAKELSYATDRGRSWAIRCQRKEYERLAVDQAVVELSRAVCVMKSMLCSIYCSNTLVQQLI